jgi:hypothetical protein
VIFFEVDTIDDSILFVEVGHEIECRYLTESSELVVT